jgi:TM2 domain-containing membrane protein YozV
MAALPSLNSAKLPSHMPETALPQHTARQRNWAPWIGLLLAVAAMFSNAGFFLGFPGRATAWLGVVLAVAAVVCAVIGTMRVFRQPQIYRGKVSSSILGVLSLLICGLVAFASISSRALPSSAAAPQVGQKVPDFTLADTNGNKVSLGELLGKAGSTSASANATASQAVPAGMSTATPPKAVLLVFYRGYW